MRNVAAPVLAALAALAALLASGPAASAPAATTVKVTGTEMKFALNAKSIPKGSVTFVVTNKGKLDHDFKIVGKKTPKLAPGKSAKLTVSLAKPGRYAFLCTLPGHAAAGMKGTIAVK